MLARIPAHRFCDQNDTYRAGWAELLGISREESFPLHECHVCRFVFAGLLPDDEFLRTLYDRVIDDVRAADEAQAPRWLGHQLTVAARLLEKLADRPGAVQRVLDFGCGRGVLVRALRGPRLACSGYEPSGPARAEAEAEGLRVFATLEEAAADAPFHGVILSDVLEHVAEPRAVLRSVHALVGDGGWVVVGVPDFSPKRLAAALSGACMRELNLFEHLNYFSPDSLARMLDGAGFTPDLEGHASFGLRVSARGARRWGNLARSAARVARFAVRPHATSTMLAAQKR